jgi:multicomponent Na+:H+ antiporter subunit G
MIEWLAFICLCFGVSFAVVGSIGFFRFPDVYLRLQASSKSLTFGFGFIVLGAGLASGDWVLFGKSLLAAIFQLITAPIAAHVIARSALSSKIRPTKLEPPGQ